MGAEPIFAWPDDVPVHEAVMQALGAASVCWSNPGGAGVFDPERAEAIGNELLDLLRRKLWTSSPPATGRDSDGDG
jgi:hypothetical protein